MPQPVSWKDFSRLLCKSVLLAAALTLPALLWNARAFLNDVVFFQFRQPFRQDALSYPAWLRQKDYASGLPTGFDFALIIPSSAVALLRLPRTPSGFAPAVACVYLIFFAFGKQAFCNYYFFVVGALCCAMAAATTRDAECFVRSDD